MDERYIKRLFDKHQQVSSCPPPYLVSNFFERIMALLYPEHAKKEFLHYSSFRQFAKELRSEFQHLLERNNSPEGADFEWMTKEFFEALPYLQQRLDMDVDAMYEGDPAAKSKAEVIRTYPGFFAIAAHRIANIIHKMDVMIIPRIIAEYANSKTGIDIHPGAQIGDHFCIDHGTGIVIGETTKIGHHVKIYQGVTLGAVSVDKVDASSKRHPTIENNVVLYAGATVLGGETVIGKNSVIGGSVWLTQSVPPDSRIYYQAKMTNKNGDIDIITFKP